MDLNGAAPVNGMLVYHTGSSLDGAGVYIWMTDKWVKASTGSVAYEGSESIKLDGTKFKREALTGDVTADENSNETTIGTGKVTSDHILDNTITANDIQDLAITQDAIADSVIVNSKLADASVDSRTLGAMGATDGQVLAFAGSSWAPTDMPGTIGAAGGGRLRVNSRAPGKCFSISGVATWAYPVACQYGHHTASLLHSAGSWDICGNVYTTDGKLLCATDAPCTCLFITF
jgi:hypothetical protein